MKIKNVKIGDFTILDMLEELAVIFNQDMEYNCEKLDLLGKKINSFIKMVELKEEKK